MSVIKKLFAIPPAVLLVFCFLAAAQTPTMFTYVDKHNPTPGIYTGPGPFQGQPVGTGSLIDPFIKIQAAIYEAEFNMAGQTIITVMPSSTIIYPNDEYYENIVFSGNTSPYKIKLRSNSGASNTIINGGQIGSVVIFNSVGTLRREIIGFTIKNGYNTTGGGISVYESAPHIKDNTIIQNHATERGGAIWIYSSPGTYVFNNTIGEHSENPNYVSNQADFDGGGIACIDTIGTVTIEDNIFWTNKANGYGSLDGNGGGVFIHADEQLTDGFGTVYVLGNIFIRNIADNHGGAIRVASNVNTVIDNNVFGDDEYYLGNQSNNGGGAIFLAIKYSNQCTDLVKKNRFFWNTSNDGGAIYCRSRGAQIVNNFFWHNSASQNGGAVYFKSLMATFMCNSTYDNDAANGGAIYVDAASVDIYIHNSILWQDNDSQGINEISNNIGLSLDVTHCDISGGWPTGYNINENPEYLLASTGNLHISQTSPAISLADSSLPSFPSGEDIDAQYRGTEDVDAGADEWNREYPER